MIDEVAGNGGTSEALDDSRAETRAAYENRAMMYAAILDELESELGTQRAAGLMKHGIYRRGRQIGDVYRGAVAAGDLAEVGRIFVERTPMQGTLFEPAIYEPPTGDRIILSMKACPLVDAWRKAGFPPERVDLLCEIAAAVDYGTFDAAGLDLEFLDRQACEDSDTCLLQLKMARPAS